jgi:hypothetical protein
VDVARIGVPAATADRGTAFGVGRVDGDRVGRGRALLGDEAAVVGEVAIRGVGIGEGVVEFAATAGLDASGDSTGPGFADTDVDVGVAAGLAVAAGVDVAGSVVPSGDGSG